MISTVNTQIFVGDLIFMCKQHPQKLNPQNIVTTKISMFIVSTWMGAEDGLHHSLFLSLLHCSLCLDKATNSVHL